MKVLLIDPNTDGYTLMPILPLAILKAYINERSDHDARIVDTVWHKTAWRAHVKQQMEAFEPDLVGLSVLSFNYNQALEIAAYIKENYTVKVLFGGTHAILTPDDIIQNDVVDFVCTGEGEVTLKTLLDHGLNAEGVNGIWYKNSGEVVKNPKQTVTAKLDTLPFPDWDDFELENYFTVNNNHLPAMASRGCPYPCTYCSSKAIAGALEGKYVRFRSVENVLDEIGLRIEKYYDRGLRYIFFYDDIFILNKAFVIPFCEGFRKRNYGKYVQWNANVRADLVKDGIMKAMRESGCYEVRMGIESANDFVRNDIYERKMPQEQIYDAVRIIRKYGLQLRVQFIIGSPYETIEMMEENFEMAKKINADYELFPILMPLPGTKMKELCEKEGLIETRGFKDSRTMYTRPVIRTKYTSREQIQEFVGKIRNYQIRKYLSQGLALRGPVFFLDLLKFFAYYRPKFRLEIDNAYRFTIGKYKLQNFARQSNFACN